MATPYTLEEAAEKLGITPSELSHLQTDPQFKNLKPMRDGANLRFRTTDIDELARVLGLGSDAEGPSPEAAKKAPPKKKANDEPLLFGDSDDDEILAGFAADPAKPAPKAPPATPKKKKPESDSDVRLETVPPTRSPGGKSNVATEEEIDFDLPPPSGVLSSGSSSQHSKGGKSGKLVPTSGNSGRLSSAGGSVGKAKSAGGSGKMPKVPIPPPSELNSEFELSLEDSDFELELSGDDDSEEVSLGEMPAVREDKRAGESGINLSKPSDSGVLLGGKKKPKTDKVTPTPAAPGSDDEIDFELSLDLGASSSRLTGPKSKKIVEDDSEFELSLDDGNSDSDLDDPTTAFRAEEESKDIFETDFEIPALDDDSASEALALDDVDTDLDSSDFDLALDESDASDDGESGSEVVVLDEDEDEPKPKGKKRPASIGDALKGAGRGKKKPVDDDEDVEFDDLDESESASAALRGVRHDEDEDEEEELATAGAPIYAKSKPWGVFTIMMLFTTVPILFVGALMGYELLRGQWGYQQPYRPASPIVQFLAEKFDVAPKQ